MTHSERAYRRISLIVWSSTRRFRGRLRQVLFEESQFVLAGAHSDFHVGLLHHRVLAFELVSKMRLVALRPNHCDVAIASNGAVILSIGRDAKRNLDGHTYRWI